MKNYKVVNSCEVCGNTNLDEVLNLGEHPLCDDLIEIGSKKENIKYPVKVALCNKCFTAHQIFQVDKSELFPKSYHYRARFTKDVINGMKDLKDSIVKEKGSIENKVFLDIGCNDGSLLNFFRDDGAITIGIEPTDASKEAAEKGHEIFNDFFDLITVKKILKKYPKIDFITFTNVFAHIENLPLLLSNLKKLINDDTTIIIENHYLGSILEKNQFDTFYHEHPRTYGLNSFRNISKKLDMQLANYQFPQRYGGNIRVFLEKNKKTKDLSTMREILKKEELFSREFKKMEKFLEKWKTLKKIEILKIVEKIGPIPAKAFPGRAAILIKILDINEKHISAVYERSGSQKIGNYVPGTKIPILDELEFFEKNLNSKAIINLAWHISSEIKIFLRNKGYNGKIINILD